MVTLMSEVTRILNAIGQGDLERLGLERTLRVVLRCQTLELVIERFCPS
jgi:hypothetical protein